MRATILLHELPDPCVIVLLEQLDERFVVATRNIALDVLIPDLKRRIYEGKKQAVCVEN